MGPRSGLDVCENFAPTGIGSQRFRNVAEFHCIFFSFSGTKIHSVLRKRLCPSFNCGVWGILPRCIQVLDTKTQSGTVMSRALKDQN